MKKETLNGKLCMREISKNLDEKGEVCGFYIHFIDIKREYSEEEEEE